MSNAAVLEAVRHTPIGGAGATSVVATTPGGGKTGKTLVAMVSWRGVGTVTPVEAGWTERYDFQDTIGPQFALYSRPSTDAEPSTYTFNFSGTASRVVASLFFISNSINGIEAQSVVEGAGNSQTATCPSVTSPGDNRVCVRIWNKTHTNNMIVPSYLKIHSRWNTGGTDVGAVGHVITADVVNTGPTVEEVCQIETSARDWRSVSFVVGPGSKFLSKADRVMQELSGFKGSISDKERARLLNLLNLVDPQPRSLMDLYKAAEIAGQSDGKNRLL